MLETHDAPLWIPLLLAAANVVATDLNRRLGPLIETAGLELEREEPVLFGGLFKVAVLRKLVPPHA